MTAWGGVIAILFSKLTTYIMFLLFDIGGTKMRIAVGGREEIVGTPVIMPTPASYEEGIELLTKTANDLSGGKGKIKAVVGGLAGAFDRQHSMIMAGSNISSWIGKPVKKMLEHAFQVSVQLENDAALGGLGEAVAGAGKDYEIVAYITVSTGVGGARITGKTIDRHVFGFEPEYQIIDFDGSSCTRCSKHNLGAHISGKGIEEHYGKKGEELDDPAIWEDITAALAIGLTNTIVHWSPDIVVLGGSVMQRISIERVRELIGEALHVYPELPAIERAQLGDRAGLEGALQIARKLDIIRVT